MQKNTILVTRIIALAAVAAALIVAVSPSTTGARAGLLSCTMVGMIVACRPSVQGHWIPSMRAEATRIAITSLAICAAALAVAAAAGAGAPAVEATLELALASAGISLLRSTRTFDVTASVMAGARQVTHERTSAGV